MKLLLLTSVFGFLSFQGIAQTDNSSQRKAQFNLTKSGLAIEGYDPVAYFTMNKPQKGKPGFSVFYEGATFYFTNTENKELFKKNPSKYEPQYGGWCAYAMGNDGSKVEVDPETFKIVNGKLYLFYNKFFTNTLKSWNKNESLLMNNANTNWSKFFKP